MINPKKVSLLCIGVFSLAVFVGTFPAAAVSSSMISSVTKQPEYVGQCFLTSVVKVETRLEDAGQSVPDSGSVIELLDGHYNVAYDLLPAISQSKKGDRIRLCVIHLPTHCPNGDTRGIRYRGRNLRTGMSWVASDAEHVCGGA